MPLLTIIGSAATVALIVAANRWLYSLKGAVLPVVRSGTCIYRINWQWRVVAFLGEALFIVISLGSWHDFGLRSRTTIMMLGAAAVYLPICMWLASGTIRTDDVGITRKGLWHSRSFQWNDITQVRLHTNQVKFAELFAGRQRMNIDFRIAAFDHLLGQIKDRTGLQPTIEDGAG
jgi:hypothetical protein